MAIYAVRFGKWVEVRESPVPLVKREMAEIVTVQEQKVDYIPTQGPYGPYMMPKYSTVSKKKKIKDIIWDGGTFIVAVAYSRWSPTGTRKGLPVLEDGECKLIEKKELAEALKSEYSRDKLLGSYRNNLRLLNNLEEDEDDDNYDDNYN